MKATDLPEYVEHFRQRVLQDAFLSASADYWRRRAETFEAAMPREDDYTGQATPDEIQRRRDRLNETAFACRVKAELMIGGRL